MERREMLRALAVFAITPRWLLAQAGQSTSAAPALPAPVPWTLGLSERTPLPHTTVPDASAATVATFFTAAETATLRHLADTLLPRSGQRPGALDAETPAFLDFLIGHSPAVRGALYRQGLARLQRDAQLRFHQAFQDLNPSETATLLQPWLRTWMTDHPPTEPHADFINIAHADIRAATLNSEPWIRSLSEAERKAQLQLYWSPIEPDVYAERPTSVHTRPTQTIAAPKATHEIRSFPQ